MKNTLETQKQNLEEKRAKILSENTLKSSNFLTRLQKSTEDKESQEQLFKAKEAYLTLETSILATEKALNDAERKAEESYTQTPFNPANIIKAKAEVNSLYEGLEALYELREKEFGI